MIGDRTASEGSQVPLLPERELTLTGYCYIDNEPNFGLRVERCFRKGREVAVACWRGENQLQVIDSPILAWQLGLSGDWLWQRGGDLLHWAGTANLVSVLCSGRWLFSYSFYLKFWNVLPQYLGRDHLMCGGTDQSVFRFSIEIVTRQIFAMLNHLIQGDWFEEEEDSGKY